ncbi:hypothetical protein L1049_005354 [Liquidambar formosana]|uniref:Uncharacterized protein n=1 Tax=Liquidambar formosana TaxID=63359 RepID=A0AAP0RU66_LIQFO
MKSTQFHSAQFSLTPKESKFSHGTAVAPHTHMASKNTSSTRTCLCSPTTHPGSFRCILHRSARKVSGRTTSSVHLNRSESLEMTSKANLLKAFLMHIIKPSSQGLQRRKNFQPRPTRFCLMNSNGDGVAVS